MKNTLIFGAIAVVAVAGIWMLTANHGTSAPADSGSPTPTVSEMQMPSVTPTPTRLPGTSVKPTPTAKPTPGIIIHESQILKVNIQNFAFSPATVTVQRGDVVVFKNMDSVAHTVTADAGAFDSGMISTDQSWTLATANLAPGTYAFHCTPHPSMRGTVVVQ